MWFLGQVPRQVNGTDCGFYVMACVRYLIGGILQGNKGKNWVSLTTICMTWLGKDILGAWHLTHLLVCKCLQLTKNWFHFEDVCTLRTDLHTWCLKCLNELWLWSCCWNFAHHDLIFGPAMRLCTSWSVFWASHATLHIMICFLGQPCDLAKTERVDALDYVVCLTRPANAIWTGPTMQFWSSILGRACLLVLQQSFSFGAAI